MVNLDSVRLFYWWSVVSVYLLPRVSWYEPSSLDAIPPIKLFILIIAQELVPAASWTDLQLVCGAKTLLTLLTWSFRDGATAHEVLRGQWWIISESNVFFRFVSGTDLGSWRASIKVLALFVVVCCCALELKSSRWIVVRATVGSSLSWSACSSQNRWEWYQAFLGRVFLSFF
jgi:hypothetical protein